jgi:hypothetical protein
MVSFVLVDQAYPSPNGPERWSPRTFAPAKAGEPF